MLEAGAAMRSPSPMRLLEADALATLEADAAVMLEAGAAMRSPSPMRLLECARRCARRSRAPITRTQTIWVHNPLSRQAIDEKPAHRPPTGRVAPHAAGAPAGASPSALSRGAGDRISVSLEPGGRVGLEPQRWPSVSASALGLDVGERMASSMADASAKTEASAPASSMTIASAKNRGERVGVGRSCRPIMSAIGRRISVSRSRRHRRAHQRWV